MAAKKNSKIGCRKMSKLIIVGELLNSSRIKVLEALKNRDEKFIINEAKKQKDAGADYLDVNVSMMMEKEVGAFEWVVPLIQSKIDIPLAIDTPDPVAMEAGLKVHKGRALINSLNGKKESLKQYIPLIEKYNAKAIVMCLDERGIMQSASNRFQIAVKIIKQLENANVVLDDIFIDPIVQAAGIDETGTKVFLDSLYKIKSYFPSIKTIAGISNISYGMPERQFLNQVFFVLALYMGLDAAILDPLDGGIIKTLVATEGLLGKDPLFKNYLSYIRRKTTK